MQAESENLWDDRDGARALLQRKAEAEKSLADLTALESDYKNLSELCGMEPVNLLILDEPTNHL